jgi:hypothetical protein
VPVRPTWRWRAEPGPGERAAPAVAYLRAGFGAPAYPSLTDAATDRPDPARRNLLPLLAGRLGLDLTWGAALRRDRPRVDVKAGPSGCRRVTR